MRRKVKIGLLGMGVVGSEVARRLLDDHPLLSERAGCDLELAPVLVRDPTRARPGWVERVPLTADPDAVLDDPEVGIVIELIGGEEPARSLIARALASGKHVVTANKLVMAKHGTELTALAREHGVSISMEAAVGAGIPLLRMLELDLAANSIRALAAVINGTTNFVLDRMGEDGLSLDSALAQARALGYAEADASADVDGWDACYKLTLLCLIAFGAVLDPFEIPREGIANLDPTDFEHARRLGYAIKLVARAQRQDGGLAVAVTPMLVSLRNPLAGLSDALNGILIDGDLTGRLFISGEGAGGRPTASAVLGDLLQLLVRPDLGPAMAAPRSNGATALTTVPTRSYLRVRTEDRPGVLAEVAGALAAERISIASMNQPAPGDEGEAELIFVLHRAEEEALARARERLGALDCVRSLCSLIRLLD